MHFPKYADPTINVLFLLSALCISAGIVLAMVSHVLIWYRRRTATEKFLWTAEWLTVSSMGATGYGVVGILMCWIWWVIR